MENKKNFAARVNKIATMLVRMVALEGLQPMATEAFPEGESKRGDGRSEISFWIVMIIVFMLWVLRP